MIKAKIYNQNIKLDCESVASDSVKYLKIKFYEDEDWNGAVKTAVFKNEEQGKSVTVILEEGNDLYLGDNTCYIPFEVIKPPCFSVSVSGLKGDTIITTLPERIRVYQSGDITGEEADTYTPSQYEQLVGIYTDAKNIAQSVRDDADNGVFKGEKGKDAITDIEYNPESENAQSGKAVAEALGGLTKVFAPVIKQNLKGKMITANDVSAVEHDLKVSVIKLKNHFDVNCVTQQDNDNAKVEIKSENILSITPKEANRVIILGKLTDICPAVKGGDTIDLFYESSASKNSLGLQYTDGTDLNGGRVIFTAGASKNTIATLPEDIDEIYVFYTGLGDVTDRTLSEITLTNGATEDASDVNVKRYGKNLADLTKGLNACLKLNADGSYTMERTSSARFSGNIPLYIPENTVIAISAKILKDTTGMNVGIEFTKFDGTKSYGSMNISTGQCIANSGAKEIASFRFFHENSVQAGQYAQFKDFQVEINTTPTEYEPYKLQTVMANSDGTVNGLTSLSPNMTLLTEDNVDLECEYMADTKAYIDNKIAAIK